MSNFDEMVVITSVDGIGSVTTRNAAHFVEAVGKAISKVESKGMVVQQDLSNAQAEIAFETEKIQTAKGGEANLQTELQATKAECDNKKTAVDAEAAAKKTEAAAKKTELETEFAAKKTELETEFAKKKMELEAEFTKKMTQANLEFGTKTVEVDSEAAAKKTDLDAAAAKKETELNGKLQKLKAQRSAAEGRIQTIRNVKIAMLDQEEANVEADRQYLVNAKRVVERTIRLPLEQRVLGEHGEGDTTYAKTRFRLVSKGDAKGRTTRALRGNLAMAVFLGIETSSEWKATLDEKPELRDILGAHGQIPCNGHLGADDAITLACALFKLSEVETPVEKQRRRSHSASPESLRPTKSRRLNEEELMALRKSHQDAIDDIESQLRGNHGDGE